MKKLDTLVYEALSSIDPVEEIENLTGKSVDNLSQDEQLSMLRMALMQNKAKDEMLSQASDLLPLLTKFVETGHLGGEDEQ